MKSPHKYIIYKNYKKEYTSKNSINILFQTYQRTRHDVLLFIFICLFQMLRSNLELLSYKTSMSQRCGAALDISTEEKLCTNSAKLHKFPGFMIFFSFKNVKLMAFIFVFKTNPAFFAARQRNSQQSRLLSCRPIQALVPQNQNQYGEGVRRSASTDTCWCRSGGCR